MFLFMVAFTVWAATQENILAIPAVVLNDVWFKATLFDAYFALLSIFLWVCYREKSLVLKLFMLVAIVCLGNIAISLYVLSLLLGLKPGEGVEKLFARR
jgi:predicted permease